MKFILFLLLSVANALGEKTGEEIVFIIQAEIILFPLIILCSVFPYLNYKEMIFAIKSVYTPVQTSFEMKPLIRTSEPEMEP